MASTGMNRKNFIKKSVLGISGFSMLSSFGESKDFRDEKHGGTVLQENQNISAMDTLLFKNVRLETGFVSQGEEVIGTKTDLFQVEVVNGKISKITAQHGGAVGGPVSGAGKVIDAKGKLMLPAFKDMHIHLDKTFYGEKWQAVRRGSGGVKGMIALEQKTMPEILKNATAKAEKLIELLQSKGSTFARSHVNVEPTSKLEALKKLQLALDNKKDSFSAELVAFPQHGLFYTDSVPYMKDAAQAGIDFIGGVDPFSLDGSIEKPIDFTVQLALDHGKGIDIHLHEGGESGVKTVEYLLDKVLENPGLKGKTYLSHCFVLGRVERQKQEELAVRLAEAEVGIISTIPFGGLQMPIPMLLKHGVKVMTGNDSIVDHWNTFGTGSVLEKANLAAQLYGYVSEFDLSRALKLANVEVLPLDDKGNMKWPKVGDVADFVLMEASCSAEAVSRVSDVNMVVKNGKVIKDLKIFEV
ncbi:amidohydrolase [Sphingobacterium sp. CZ-2]|uniref:amidohydrolase n=1 Tax=Sphingobacterium sp. CZ-2 TaxID=2557994 RepID=UPI0010700234|nr:amidohydrolase [Sphingobacterium sp. CZ-2]QBR13209.1 deaminase [Sphingobacterium sp. CZ-2]